MDAYNELPDLLGEKGWWPKDREVQGSYPYHAGDGILVEGTQPNCTATGQYTWNIELMDLFLALIYVEHLKDLLDPEIWQAYAQNCTDMAIYVGQVAGVETLDPDGIDTPSALSDYLNEQSE